MTPSNRTTWPQFWPGLVEVFEHHTNLTYRRCSFAAVVPQLPLAIVERRRMLECCRQNNGGSCGAGLTLHRALRCRLYWGFMLLILQSHFNLPLIVLGKLCGAMSSNLFNICILCLKVYCELICVRQNAVCFSTEQFIWSNIKKILLAMLLVFCGNFCVTANSILLYVTVCLKTSTAQFAPRQCQYKIIYNCSNRNKIKST